VTFDDLLHDLGLGGPKTRTLRYTDAESIAFLMKVVTIMYEEIKNLRVEIEKHTDDKR
jgi:hypothetical protein